MTACEALGSLRYGKKDGGSDFFENYLLPKKWRIVSRSIYDALRNGLAHSFSTKVFISAPDKPIELGISWGKETHFSYDSNCSVLFINVLQLSNDLRNAFSRYKTELQQAPELRDLFVVWRKKQRFYKLQNINDIFNWKMLIGIGDT